MTPWQTYISLIPETSLAGSTTGDVLPIRGQTKISWQPILEGGLEKVGVWRLPIADNWSRRFGAGAIEMEYSHTETTRRMIDSLFGLVSAVAGGGGTTIYAYRPHRLEARQSFQIDVSKQTAGPHYRFKGCVMEALTLSVRRTEAIKLRWEFKFVMKETFGGAVPSFTNNPGHKLVTHQAGTLAVNTVAMSEAVEFSARFQNAIVPAGFTSSTKVPTKFTPAARFDFGGDIVEFERDASTIPGFVHSQTVVPMSYTLALPSSRQFKVDWPRIIFRAGQPDALALGDNPYRASFDGQHQEDIGGTEPLILFVI
jgi:hypothetical protein